MIPPNPMISAGVGPPVFDYEPSVKAACQYSERPLRRQWASVVDTHLPTPIIHGELDDFVQRREAMGVPEFDDDNFNSEVLQASGPVLVDFWAPWCGPCRQIAPVIEQLAGENQGAIKIGKLNVDNAPNSAQSYGVSSIPTLMLFKNGEVIDRFVGVQPKTRLQQAIDAAKS
jgi:thioredoxin 1